MQLEHGDDYCTSWYAMKEALRRRFAPPFEPEKNILSSSGSSDLVASKFSSATPFEKNNSTNQPAIMGLPSDIPTATSIVGEDVPLNTSISDISSPLEQQAGVPEQISIDERVDLSLASGLHATDSSCDTQPDIKIDDNDVASNGLSMMAREVHSDGTTIDVRGQRSNIFHSECKVHDKVCKLIIDGGSFTNVISSDLVHALSLSTWRLPSPCYMQWMNQSGTLKITHKVRVKFSIGNYVDTVDCDVAPMSACHLLLGRPWQFDLDATHGGRSNHYSFVHKGDHHVLRPMPDSAINAEIFGSAKLKKKTAVIIPKPRTALLQEGENDMDMSSQIIALSSHDTSSALKNVKMQVASADNEPLSELSKPRTVLFEADNDAVAVRPIIASSENFCTPQNILGSDVLIPHMNQLESNAIGTKDKIKVLAKEAPKYIPKPRTALFQGSEDDEPMAPQIIHACKSGIISNMITGVPLDLSRLKFGAIHFVEKYSNSMAKFTSMGLSSNIIFRGATFKGEEIMKPKNIYIEVGSKQGDIT